MGFGPQFGFPSGFPSFNGEGSHQSQHQAAPRKHKYLENLYRDVTDLNINK